MTAPSGRRAPPAFQMYAPDRLADRNFKTMTLAERGLMHSMELECWCNRTLPADKRDLARVLGIEAADVEQNLTERVMRYFAQREAEIYSPELDTYREKLDERYEGMSKGGKKGAERRWKSQEHGGGNGGAINQSTSGGNGALSREEQKGEEQKSVSIKGSVIPSEHSEFVAALAGEPDFLSEGARRYAAVRG